MFLRSCELCTVNVNGHMRTMQVLVNQKCRTTILGSLDLLANARVDHVYISTTVQKLNIFALL